MRKENEFHDVEMDVIQNELKELKHFKLFFERDETPDWSHPDSEWLYDAGDDAGNGAGMYQNPNFTGTPGQGTGPMDQQVYDKRAEADNRALIKKYKHSEGMERYSWESDAYKAKLDAVVKRTAGLKPSGTDPRYTQSYAHLKPITYKGYSRTDSYTTIEHGDEQSRTVHHGGEIYDRPTLERAESYERYVNLANTYYKGEVAQQAQHANALAIGSISGAVLGEGETRRSGAGPRQVRAA